MLLHLVNWIVFSKQGLNRQRANMKTITRLAAISTGLTLAAMPCNAQNLAQNITIALAGYVQGPSSDNGSNTTQTVVSAQVTTKTVIQALGTALGVTFSSKAQLEAILDTSGTLQSIVVTNGGQQTDVTSFFTITDVNFVSKTRTNDSTGASTQTQYGIREFSFTSSGGLSFDVQGFATIAASTSSGTAGTTTLVQYTATVAGSGTDANGNTMVLKGTIIGAKD
jgi:hypothetical protein